MPSLRSIAAFAALATGFLASCGDRDASALTERSLSPSEREFRLVETSRERFRYQSRPAADSHDGHDHGPSATGLVHDTPEGWTEKPGSAMRDLSFSFGENGEGECYVARLPGAGGGLAANVNRWRAQMGAAPLTDEQVAALPTRPLFGQPAHFVSVDGTFSPGMGSQATFSDYRLVGLILSAEAGAVFVKMTGPRELVETQLAAFDQFVSSLDVKLP